LSPQAVSILRALPKRDGRELVFGARNGGFSGWSKCKERLDARMAQAGYKLKPWRLHDLRRTAATMMADHLSVEPHVIETILNHRSGFRSGVSGTYNRGTYMNDRTKALVAWGEHVEALVAGERGRVVSLNARRG
jgi:integrase